MRRDVRRPSGRSLPSFIVPFFSLAVVSAALAQSGPAAPSGAEQEPTLTESVVVSANLTPTEEARVGSSVTVIDAEQLAAQPHATALEVLRAIPGLALVQNGGPGRAASAFLRGANSSHTLVLVDGVRVNAPGTGAYDLADLPVADIERIEVLRGPQSSLYGSEAIGGVVNIVSRRGRQGQHGALTVEAGSHGQRRGRVSLDGANDRFDWRLGAERGRQPGFTLAAERAGDRDLLPYRNRNASALLGARLGESGRAELSLRSIDATAHPDSFEYGVGPVPAPLYTQDRRQFVGSAAVVVPVTSWWRQTVRAGYDRDHLRGHNDDPLAPSWEDFTLRYRTVSAAVQSDLSLAANDTLSIGYSWEQRTGEDVGNFDQRATLRALYAENQWSWRGRVYLTGAVRRDDHSTFGGKTTWRGTAAYLVPGTGTKLHGSYGTGFKAPTLVDLYYPWYGNTALKPESSRGWDAGVEQRFADGRVVADVTWFATDIDDLIEAAPPTYMAQNVAEAEAHGVETSLTWTASKALQVGLAYTQTRSEDRATGRPLPRRPRHQGSLSIAWQPLERLDTLVSAVVVRDRIDAGGVPMDDYVRVDGKASWDLGRGLSVFARGQNLLDRDYEELPGFVTPGRLLSVGLTFGY